MRKLPALSVTLALALAAVALAAPPAVAQTSVTLSASPSQIAFGQEVTLSGTVSGAGPGTPVQIVDATEQTVASAATDAAGAFATQVAPDGTETYRALVGSVSSAPVTVQVRAVVSIDLSPVRLFDTVTVSGTVAPTRSGHVELQLRRGGRTVDAAHVELDAGGRYRATFEIGSPGAYRARASFAAEDLLRASATSDAGSTPLPRLSQGDEGAFVRLLERRLVELDYRLTGARDGTYDLRTADAVVAFHKVQRMDRTFVVTPATWRRLADPVVPRARLDRRGFHVEVDQTRQVLYTVQGGEITNILHVSTGAGGATHDGRFRVFRKLAGYSPNRLYFPSYFDGLRALHGWTEVPTYAASHGCVRIPYWNARWIYALVDVGTQVVIYH